MKQGDLVSIRLITGEYVIAAWAGAELGVVHLSDPLIYEVVPGQKPRQFGVRFTPLVPLSQPGCKVPLNLSATIFVSDEVHPEIAKRFRATISGIVVPDKEVAIAQK